MIYKKTALNPQINANYTLHKSPRQVLYINDACPDIF